MRCWPLILVLVVGCGRTELLSDAGPDAGRDGGADAGDAGADDAGRDGGADGGADGGGDAGRPDGGPPDGGGFDAGACALVPRAPLAELAKSPRANPGLELLVLHGAPWLFLVDDATYARADRELGLIHALDAGPQSFIPTWGESLILRFDDAGVAELDANRYDAWACLNALYRGTPQRLGRTDFVFVGIAPIVSLPQLGPDYAALPHVASVELNSYGVCAACGCSADTCLDLAGDAGAWSWLWYTQSRQCEERWYRLQTAPDGGARFERWLDAGFPRAWLDRARPAGTSCGTYGGAATAVEQRR